MECLLADPWIPLALAAAVALFFYGANGGFSERLPERTKRLRGCALMVFLLSSGVMYAVRFFGGLGAPEGRGAGRTALGRGPVSSGNKPVVGRGRAGGAASSAPKSAPFSGGALRDATAGQQQAGADYGGGYGGGYGGSYGGAHSGAYGGACFDPETFVNTGRPPF
jgi:hypothetical protein